MIGTGTMPAQQKHSLMTTFKFAPSFFVKGAHRAVKKTDEDKNDSVLMSQKKGSNRKIHSGLFSEAYIYAM